VLQQLWKVQSGFAPASLSARNKARSAASFGRLGAGKSGQNSLSTIAHRRRFDYVWVPSPPSLRRFRIYDNGFGPFRDFRRATEIESKRADVILPNEDGVIKGAQQAAAVEVGQEFGVVARRGEVDVVWNRNKAFLAAGLVRLIATSCLLCGSSCLLRLGSCSLRHTCCLTCHRSRAGNATGKGNNPVTTPIPTVLAFLSLEHTKCSGATDGLPDHEHGMGGDKSLHRRVEA
jgi:hypothetical protein